MNIDKAIEILNINIRLFPPSIPPDVLTALKMSANAPESIKLFRATGQLTAGFQLKGETPK